MILTQLPDLPPRPESPRNAAFRREFYRRWGKENCIVAGAARRAEYAVHRQTLSIKTVARGREHYFVDGRRLTVTDETYLVLNEQREYSSLIEAPQSAYSFCMFFRPRMANEIAGAARQTLQQAIDADGEVQCSSMQFGEHLRRHDTSVTPVMNFIRRHVQLGVTDPSWYEEQFLFLLSRLVAQETRSEGAADRIDCIGAVKRRELMKRLGWATDFIHSNLHREFTLVDIATAARLSQFHFVRVFHQAYGMTPMAYVRAQRTRRALALLYSTKLSMSEIAEQVGLTRLALWRHVRRAVGVAPQRLRQSSTVCAA